MIHSESPLTDFVGSTKLLSTPVVAPPNAGSSWKGVQHGTLMTIIQQTLSENGVWLHPVMKPMYYLSRDQADLTACIVMEAKSQWGMKLYPCLGIMASNSRRLALRAYAGCIVAQDMIPLVVSQLGGQDTSRRPHWRYTDDFDGKKVAEEIVNWWKDEVKQCSTIIRHLKDHYDEGTVRIMRSAEEGILPWAKTSRVLRDWNRLLADKNHNRPRTTWDLYQVFANVVKLKCSPPVQMPKLFQLTELCMSEELLVRT